MINTTKEPMTETKQITFWMTLTIILCVLSAFLGANNYNHDIQVKAEGIPTSTASGTINKRIEIDAFKNRQPENHPLATKENVRDSRSSVVLSPIEQEIKDVFGKDYDKAIKVAMCESRLNPYAVNDNRKWGGVGRDRGIFQINDVYHPLTDVQAFDYKQNIRYAFRMFANDGNSFRRWTCGRYYGI